MHRNLNYDVLLAASDLNDVLKEHSIKDILLAMEMLVDKRAAERGRKEDERAAVVLGMAAREVEHVL